MTEPTVRERGEHALIEWLRQRLPAPGRDVVVGIGDDAAVLVPPRNELIVQTTDALVEGVHVLGALISPFDIGRRAVAVNLSDLAAMGARPAWVLLSLVLPETFPAASFEALVDGAADEARRAGATIVGGNIARTSGPLVVDVTATGHVRPRRLLRRDTARAGDELWITGTVGAAAAGLEMLRQGGAVDAECVRRYATPTPRLREAWSLARERAVRAAIDVSDGLADAVRQLSRASGAGARLDAEAVPVEPAARQWFLAHGHDALLRAMTDSDDYELLVAVPPKSAKRLRAAARAFSTPLTRVGVLTSGAACVLERDGREEAWPDGFAHFARSG